jgi:hypothetical protein
VRFPSNGSLWIVQNWNMVVDTITIKSSESNATYRTQRKVGEALSSFELG